MNESRFMIFGLFRIHRAYYMSPSIYVRWSNVVALRAYRCDDEMVVRIATGAVICVEQQEYGCYQQEHESSTVINEFLQR